MNNHKKLLLILGAIVAIGPLSIDMYLPALPALQGYFNTDASTVQLSLASYFIGLAVGQLVYGPISDRVGRLGPLRFGLIVYILASIACAVATSAEALVWLRLLQALGGCAGMVIVRAIVRDRFEPQEMAQVLSTLVLIMGLAPILAPLMGSQILVYFGWQAIFIVLACFGLFCLLLVMRGMEETWQPPEKLLTGREILSTYARLLCHRRFMGFALSGGIAQAGMFAYIAASSFVYIQVYGVSTTDFGWYFGANAAGLIIASQTNARLLRRYRAEHILHFVLAFNACCGLLMLGLILADIGGLWGVALPLFAAISSLGFTFPNSTAAAMAPFGDRAGMAAALLGTLQFSLAAMASVAVGWLHDGTALPLAAVISVCGITSVVIMRVMVGATTTEALRHNRD
ncbi:MAG TPA: Bcr/CflA family drug resistance efflux transporter [Gammaproteobacteria bacterium]|nr:Bcr/CflA family drug resistance efflux transporter [Gammaproteobacteria bacterium]